MNTEKVVIEYNVELLDVAIESAEDKEEAKEKAIQRIKEADEEELENLIDEATQTYGMIRVEADEE